jgi:cellulose synthase/poly-beta-1,6-N-acetylglucosamine synthase-like glycosyltransferase
MSAIAVAFWTSAALIVHTHVTYPLSLAALARLRRPGGRNTASNSETPCVSLIIAAHNEEPVIARRVSNALESDYPRELFEVIVASDGSEDRTAELARTAGADLVLDLSRRGKVEAQNAAVEAAKGDVLAFSDANALWKPDALRLLTAACSEAEVGYVCGQLRLTGGEGENQEGAYWRYEMAVRSLESRLGGVTAGNGAIYAVRRDSYVAMPSDRSHDLCLPYLAVKSGRRAVYEPAAKATEPAAPTLGGEWRRKRRMMNRAWGIVLNDGILSPRGYSTTYAYEIFSHRGLRYATPFLHLAALGTNVALLGESPVYTVTLAAQVALLAGAALARVVPVLPFRLCAYYVAVTASIAAGLADRIKNGPAKTWEPVEGTRWGV